MLVIFRMVIIGYVLFGISINNSYANTLTNNQSLIVDCLLPGKVRKLGINRTYVSRKRPRKISANDCEIGGGDYVEFDRTTIGSSLQVWQDAASQGDAKAQYFVGEIYEKGLGSTPDYDSAVLWYKRAIKQGYSPAKMSLGRLYELGLGVEKDLVKAMNLYRQASGLEDDEIAYASVFETIRQGDLQRIKQLEIELEAEKRKALSIERRSQVLESDVQRSKRTQVKLKQKLEELKTKFKHLDGDARQSISKALDSKQLELNEEAKRSQILEKRLKEARSELLLAQQRVESLAPTSKPKLALKWPEFKQEDNNNTAYVPAGSIVNLVGAIENFNNVKTFSIDRIQYQLDANGLFLKSLDVGSEPIELHLEVIANDGATSNSLITIVPSTELDVSLAGSGALTQKKIEFGQYHALIIGNNSYDLKKGWDPLDTAVSDASAIAEVLEKQYGFKVRLELNANRDTMLTALEDMRKSLTSKDNLLVYYAGHGLVDPENDQGYWVPVDGASDSAVRWISNASITDQIRAMTARNVMVIADSCYSGSLMRSGIVTLRSGLSAEKKALRLTDDVKLMTRVALSSGGLQPVIDSLDNSTHSVFASALLKVLKGNTELLDADSLATQVAHSVAIATQDNVQQVPRYAPLAAGGHQGGEFYFTPNMLTQ